MLSWAQDMGLLVIALATLLAATVLLIRYGHPRFPYHDRDGGGQA